MTENDYIKAKALGSITSAIKTLQDLVPENLNSVIIDSEHKKVMSILDNWQTRLFEQIETSEDAFREKLFKYTKWQNEVFYETDEEIFNDIDKFLNQS